MSLIKSGLVIAGRYRLDVLAGEGGMSTVWRGTDLSLSRDVAVKVLREEIAAQPDAVSRFRREAHAAAKLNHPNVVQIYDTGVDGDIHFIVMEYLPEPDLKKIIHDWAPLPEAKVIDVALQCCRALAYAHRNGIIHRDVKPHNILFTDDGRAKLSDFGIAAAAGTGGSEPGGFVLGSAHYIAPEQVQGSPAGPHSDIYSLGCVLYEALTGKTPYSGATERDIAAKHVNERPPSIRTLNPRISPAVEFVINKAVSREVSGRYRSAEEMLTDLGKLSGGEVLDRTGVLAVPEAATMQLQTQAPAAPKPTPPPAAGRPRTREAEVDIEPQRPREDAPISPVLRPPPPSQGSAWGTVAAVLIAILAIIVVGFLVKTAFYPGEAGKKVQVPMVKGQVLSEARETLRANDLEVGDISFEEDAMQPEGAITDQSPDAGQTVEAGTAIDLVVNRGKELVITVSVQGRTRDEANEVLEKAGLSLGEVTEVYHATIPADVVIKQAVKPGIKVEKGTGIDVVVSRGPGPETAVTPPEDDTSNDSKVDVEPEVRLVQDDSYTSGTPGERKFVVTVTVQGQELGQQIEVVKQDDRGGRVVVLSQKLNPNQTRDVPVITEGAAIIEVKHNGRVVFRQEEPAPNVPALGPDGDTSASGGSEN